MKPSIPKGTRDFGPVEMAKRNYIKFLEAELETPIKIISIGPDRAQTIVRGIKN